MKQDRPVYLNLFEFRFPVTAIASIFHRISGVLLFLYIPLIICMLQVALHSSKSFNQLVAWMGQGYAKVLLWVLGVALSYHLLAGIRHLLMDCGVGESKRGGRVSAYLVMVLAVVMMFVVGGWLW